jgi:ABC-type phosphate/phosphonate transport system substrate-binding protein
MFSMFSRLAEYLSRETGEKVSVVIPLDFAAFKDAVRHNKFELAFANPRISVQLATGMLTPNTTKSGDILKSEGLMGIEPVSDEDYKQLREAACLVGAL